MPINVKGLFETLQYKANNIDSSTSTAEILDTLKAIQRTDGNTIISYDSDGAFPDASTTNVKIGYNKQTGAVKFNNGTWDTLTIELGTPPQTFSSFQGTQYGYVLGGNAPNQPYGVMQKYSFASDGNSTEVGEIYNTTNYISPTNTTNGQWWKVAGQSSSTHGYTTGSYINPSVGTLSAIYNKFPFAADQTTIEIGDITVARFYATGHSSDVSGYTAGGQSSPLTPDFSDTIDKFPFSTDTNATDVGDLTLLRTEISGSSSSNYGYSHGGKYTGSTASRDTIDKYPFASDANATDVGNLIAISTDGSGQNSDTHGYRAHSTTIQKFSFSADGNATDVGDLIVVKNGGILAGTSSTSSGYVAGGSSNNSIEKFPFSTDANSSDVGDLIEAGFYDAAPAQV